MTHKLPNTLRAVIKRSVPAIVNTCLFFKISINAFRQLKLLQERDGGRRMRVIFPKI